MTDRRSAVSDGVRNSGHAHSEMFDTQRYKARGWFLLLRGLAVGLSFTALVLGSLGAFVVLRVGVLNAFTALCVAEVMFLVYWRRRAAYFNSMPPRHEPEEHDPAATFEKFKAMIRAERIQVCAASLLSQRGATFRSKHICHVLCDIIQEIPWCIKSSLVRCWFS